jgi:hypothetical protein
MKYLLSTSSLAAVLALCGSVSAQNWSSPKPLPPAAGQPNPHYKSLTTNVISGSGNKIVTQNNGNGVTYVHTQTQGPGNQVIVTHQGGQVVQMDQLSYKGKANKFWNQSRFDQNLGCELYWSPENSLWFRYHEKEDLYRPAPEAVEMEMAAAMFKLQKQLQEMGMKINPVTPLAAPVPVPMDTIPTPMPQQTIPTPMPESAGPKPLPAPAPQAEAPLAPTPAVVDPLPSGFLNTRLLYKPLPRVGIAEVDQAMIKVEEDLRDIELHLKRLELHLSTILAPRQMPPVTLPQPVPPVALPPVQMPLTMPAIEVSLPPIEVRGLPGGVNLIYESPLSGIPSFSSSTIQGSSNTIFNLNR